MKGLFTHILIFGILIGGTSCSKSGTNVQVSENMDGHSFTYPVLIGKENNPVFSVNVQPKAAKSSIKQFRISLNGTTSLKDIKKVKVFSTSKKDAFSEDKLFGETTDVSKEISIPGNQILQDSSNYFWLSLTLNDNANLDHTINAVITSVELTNTNIGIESQNVQSLKIGHALRKHNDDNVHTYRIPGLATTNQGTLLAVYDIRRNGSVDLQEDVDVGLNRSIDGGQTWSAMKVIMDMGEWGGLPEDENGVGDPAILVDRQTGTIWVAGLWLHGSPGKRAWWASQQGLTPQETGQFVLVKSDDDGVTWSEPINITSQIKDPNWYLILQGPGKGISTDDGTLVFPAQFKDENEVPHATIISSTDHGETWTIGTGAKSKTTEAQVVELADHSLMLNMRDDRGRDGSGARSVTITHDLGKTWTEHPTSRKALLEPVCMASLIKHTYQGNEILVFSNPFDQDSRKNMTLKVSENEGMTWDAKQHLLIDEGNGRGYSCMTSIDENTIGILYEGSQADLIYQRIKVKELMGK